MIPGFDPQTIDCLATEPHKDIFGNEFYFGTCVTTYETYAKLWKRILDWTWDDALYHIDIDPKNIRYTKGFTISQEMIDADRDRSNR